MTPPSLLDLFRKSTQDAATSVHVLPAHVEEAITGLDREMPDLQLRHRDVFAQANAWAERYDAVLAAAPEAHRAEVEKRLQAIGSRWGVAHGARITGAFPALRVPA